MDEAVALSIIVGHYCLSKKMNGKLTIFDPV